MKSVKRGRGRPAAKPRHKRGKEVMRLLNEQGLTITSAARLACVPFQLMFDVVHREPPRQLGSSAMARITTALRLPPNLVCPIMQALIK